MKTATHIATPAPRFSHGAEIENTMTDFLSIVQGLKATSYDSQRYSCAIDFLIEKLEEVYRTLEDLHGQGEVH